VKLVEIVDVRIKRGWAGLERRGHLAKAHTFEPIDPELTERFHHDGIAA
jgi:hypothetical protein